MVWSRNQVTNQMSFNKVLKTINSVDPDTAYVTITDANGNSQTIVSDSRHPYFGNYGDDPTPPNPSPEKDYLGDIQNAYWINAGDLEVGHKVIDDDGNWQTVTSVRVEQKPLNSYNLEVNIDHTFFIRGIGGLDGIWVHNENCWTSIPSNATTKQVDNQLVYSFKDRGRDVEVIDNPKYVAGGTEKPYIEVSTASGKVEITNAGEPNVNYNTNQNGVTYVKDDKGQFTSDPYNPKVDTGYNRPGYRAEFLEKVNANYTKLPNGDYYDKVNDITIKGPIDIGHAYGWEHRRLELAAKELNLTQKEFNDYVNARPQHFRLENMSRNRGHYDEKPGKDDIQGILDDMNEFLRTGK